MYQNSNSKPSKSSVWGVSIVVVLFWAIAYSLDINLLIALKALEQVVVNLLTS